MMAMEPFTNSEWDLGAAVSGYYAAKQKLDEERRQARERAKLDERREAIIGRAGVDPDAFRYYLKVKQTRAINPVKAVRMVTHVFALIKMDNLDEDVEVVEQERDRPVADNTRYGKNMHGHKAEGRPTWGLTVGTLKQKAYEADVDTAFRKCLDKLRSGVAADKLKEGEGGGRPSKAWIEGQNKAIDHFLNEARDAALGVEEGEPHHA